MKEIDDTWHDAETMPTKAGWYNCLLLDGQKLQIPASTTLAGKVVWVIPDPSVIVKWQDKLYEIK